MTKSTERAQHSTERSLKVVWEMEHSTTGLSSCENVSCKLLEIAEAGRRTLVGNGDSLAGGLVSPRYTILMNSVSGYLRCRKDFRLITPCFSH